MLNLIPEWLISLAILLSPVAAFIVLMFIAWGIGTGIVWIKAVRNGEDPREAIEPWLAEF